jgi:hypothetical protein
MDIHDELSLAGMQPKAAAVWRRGGFGFCPGRHDGRVAGRPDQRL